MDPTADLTLQLLRELRDDVHVIKTDVHGLKGDVQELKGDVQELKGDVQELKGDVQELKGDVRELKVDVHELQGDVHLIRQHLQTHDARFGVIETVLVEVAEQITAVARGVRRSDLEHGEARDRLDRLEDDVAELRKAGRA